MLNAIFHNHEKNGDTHIQTHLEKKSTSENKLQMHWRQDKSSDSDLPFCSQNEPNTKSIVRYGT